MDEINQLAMDIALRSQGGISANDADQLRRIYILIDDQNALSMVHGVMSKYPDASTDVELH